MTNAGELRVSPSPPPHARTLPGRFVIGGSPDATEMRGYAWVGGIVASGLRSMRPLRVAPLLPLEALTKSGNGLPEGRWKVGCLGIEIGITGNQHTRVGPSAECFRPAGADWISEYIKGGREQRPSVPTFFAKYPVVGLPLPTVGVEEG